MIALRFFDGDRLRRFQSLQNRRPFRNIVNAVLDFSVRGANDIQINFDPNG